MNIPENLFYTKEHEWIKIEGNVATIGITDYAQSSLGDITYVELPQIGTCCKQFKEFADIESVKAASNVYAPMSGKIIKINEVIIDKPEFVNQSPYDKGWFALIEIEDEKEKENLLDNISYSKYVKGLSK